MNRNQSHTKLLLGTVLVMSFTAYHSTLMAGRANPDAPGAAAVGAAKVKPEAKVKAEEKAKADITAGAMTNVPGLSGGAASPHKVKGASSSANVNKTGDAVPLGGEAPQGHNFEGLDAFGAPKVSKSIVDRIRANDGEGKAPSEDLAKARLAALFRELKGSEEFESLKKYIFGEGASESENVVAIRQEVANRLRAGESPDQIAAILNQWDISKNTDGRTVEGNLDLLLSALNLDKNLDEFSRTEAKNLVGEANVSAREKMSKSLLAHKRAFENMAAKSNDPADKEAFNRAAQHMAEVEAKLTTESKSLSEDEMAELLRADYMFQYLKQQDLDLTDEQIREFMAKCSGKVGG